MLAGDFKVKKAIAVLLATDRDQEVNVRLLNEASAILAPFLSSVLYGNLVLR